ncbi:MAG: TonB-dependent receptor [Mariniphaga sp.]|nr:TonB-dependent receptor [Mariniphaga sp.]
MRKILFLLVVVHGIIINVSAQSDSQILKDTVNINEVVVTGTTTKVNKNMIPLAISVISRVQIDESNESSLLPVLSGRVPGLFVTERGVTGFGVASGAAGQISIRGIGGNPTTGVLILIDGHPQYMGIMGHPLADSYVASDAEKVEVIRGPGSLLYGSNAMGGVINIITRKQTKEGFNGDARLMYGSFNTRKYMGSAGFKKDRFTVFGSVNHDQTDGHRPNSEFNITNGYLKVGYELNSNLKMGSDFSLAKFKTTDPGPDTLNAVKGSSLDITRGYFSVFLDNEYEKASGTAKFFYNFGEHTISDGFHSNDKNWGLNLSEAFKLYPGNTLSIGADFVNYGGKAENLKAMNGKGITFADTTLYELGGYVVMQQTVFDKFTINGGMRLQHNERFGNEWIPSLGFAWRILPSTTWKATVSKGFRSPTIRELYMWNHNPDLMPERIMSYETGVSQSFLNGKLNAELTGYIADGDNLIVAGAMGNLYNTGIIRNKGIEVAINASPAKNLSVNLSYSYIHMKSPLFATPKHNLFIGGRYNFKKMSFTANIHQINDLDTDATVITKLESYTLINAKMVYHLTSNFEIFASAENLLNQRYEINRYYPMPGTTAFVGLNLKL